MEVWGPRGEKVHTIASLPLADQVPIEGVPTGPRSYHWLPTEAATLVWVEALDEGDPRKKVPHRDQLFILPAPFQNKPVEWYKTEQRFFGLSWTEDGKAFIRDFDRDRRTRRDEIAVDVAQRDRT